MHLSDGPGLNTKSIPLQSTITMCLHIQMVQINVASGEREKERERERERGGDKEGERDRGRESLQEPLSSLSVLQLCCHNGDAHQ